jgi:hypothetical protein
MLPESARVWAECEVDAQSSYRRHDLEGHAPRALVVIDHLEQEEMAEQGDRRGNAHHGFTQEGEDSKEDDGPGVQMQRLDLVMRGYGIEEIGEGGTKLAERA